MSTTAVYLPGDEPYLGRESVLTFDLTIPRALEIHAEIGRRTFGAAQTPLQQAAAALIPQGVSIALSIRELIRQAYLYSAAILLRPLVERTGMVQFFTMNDEAVVAWHSGWPRASQPSFHQLVKLVMPKASEEEHDLTGQILHKLVHADPKGSVFNIFEREDGSLAFSSGKDLHQPKKADAVSVLACHCLRRLTATSVYVFGHEQT